MLVIKQKYIKLVDRQICESWSFNRNLSEAAFAPPLEVAGFTQMLLKQNDKFSLWNLGQSFWEDIQQF